MTGEFARGDCLRILDPAGNELGRGLSAFDSGHAALLVGRNSRDIEGLTGASGRAEMIHRDDMALRAE